VPLIAHKLILVSKLACVVVVGISILALKEHLADKVERIRTAAEATIGRVKTYILRYREDSRVVIARVIKHKVANFKLVNTKLLESLTNDFSDPLAAVGAYPLR
jgi:hypothetical protein